MMMGAGTKSKGFIPKERKTKKIDQYQLHYNQLEYFQQQLHLQFT